MYVSAARYCRFSHRRSGKPTFGSLSDTLTLLRGFLGLLMCLSPSLSLTRMYYTRRIDLFAFMVSGAGVFGSYELRLFLFG